MTQVAASGAQNRRIERCECLSATTGAWASGVKSGSDRADRAGKGAPAEEPRAFRSPSEEGFATDRAAGLASRDPIPERAIPNPNATADAARRQRLALLVAIAAVAAVRLWFCARVPVNSGDVLRSIHTALYVLRDGPAVMGTPLSELDPGLASLPWAGIGYSYPPLAVLIYVVAAALSPTLFSAKLALTAVEAVNAALVARITGSRWLGVLYWASPASIWWVSGEGQFEPWMALFMLAAVATVERSPPVACGLLAVGVDVKVTAILLLPWLLWTAWRSDPRLLLRSALAFGAVLAVPVLVASLWYPVLGGLVGISVTLRYNPYFWNPFDASVFGWNPMWLRAANALSTYGVLAFMTYRASRSSEGWARYGGAIAFVVLIKVSSLAQFWYLLVFPALVTPVRERESGLGPRWWLVALAPLLDLRSLVELVAGPFGWSAGVTFEGLSAFTHFGLR